MVGPFLLLSLLALFQPIAPLEIYHRSYEDKVVRQANVNHCKITYTASNINKTFYADYTIDNVHHVLDNLVWLIDCIGRDKQRLKASDCSPVDSKEALSSFPKEASSSQSNTNCFVYRDGGRYTHHYRFSHTPSDPAVRNNVLACSMALYISCDDIDPTLEIDKNGMVEDQPGCRRVDNVRTFSDQQISSEIGTSQSHKTIHTEEQIKKYFEKERSEKKHQNGVAVDWEKKSMFEDYAVRNALILTSEEKQSYKIDMTEGKTVNLTQTSLHCYGTVIKSAYSTVSCQGEGCGEYQESKASSSNDSMPHSHSMPDSDSDSMNLGVSQFPQMGLFLTVLMGAMQ